MRRNKQKGFTLVEAVVVMSLLLFLSAAFGGLLRTALTAKQTSNAAINEQIAMRQALLTITREIRSHPADMSLLPAVLNGEKENKPYRLRGDTVIRKDGTVIAQHIADFDITMPEENQKVFIEIETLSGQYVSTYIHLRLNQ